MSAFCALAFCLLASGAWGDSVSIQNPSFEITNTLDQPCAGLTACFNNGPIPGWSTLADGFGSFAPTSAYFNLPLPDGSIVAYTNGGALSQTLAGISLLPNSVYTLSVDVGRRLDKSGVGYSLTLLDGTNVFCTSSNSSGLITAGTFQDKTLTCATGATVPGGFLSIELTGDGNQIDFDNVRLDVSPSTVATPEPSALALTSVGLLVSGLFFVLSRRRHNLQSASS
jgi:hapalindole biogenesis HpiC1 cyclase-like protein